MQIDHSGRTAIVTGAGRGIGEEIALTLADTGANVVAAARTTSEIDETVDAIEERGVEGLAVSTDLSEVDDIAALIDETVERFGCPEILINNAAADVRVGNPLDHDEADVDTMLSVNVRGLFFLTQEFATVHRNSGGDSGSVVNVGSIGGHLGVPTMTVYGATKTAVFGLTRGFAAELAQDDITVNSVSPGLVNIGRIAEIIEERGDEMFDLDRIPLRRLCEPREVAYACAFLSSDFARYITGEDLLVDGGVSFTSGLYK